MGNKNTVYLTKEGLQELKDELDNLINVRRPENIVAIKEARSLGDLSENAEQEADPFESKSSNESPMAKALLNHKVGDLVTVDSPNGSYEVEIIEIK